MVAVLRAQWEFDLHIGQQLGTNSTAKPEIMNGKLHRSMELATIPFFTSEISKSSIQLDSAWDQPPSQDFEEKRANFEGKYAISELRRSCGTNRSIDPSRIITKSRLEVFLTGSGDLEAFSEKMFFFFPLIETPQSLTW